MQTSRHAYQGLTDAGIIALHRTRARAEGPQCIDDFLIKDGIVDKPEFQRLYRRLRDLIREGREFHSELGATYLLSKSTRGGRPPKGFGDDPPMAFPTLKLDPDNALTTAPVREMAEQVYARGTVAPALRDAAYEIATLPSARKQRTITGGFSVLDIELDFQRQRADFLERENELLRTGRVSGAFPSTTSPASRRNGTPATAPDTEDTPRRRN